MALKLVVATDTPKGTEVWRRRFAEAMPGDQVQAWDPASPDSRADYAIVWQPPEAFFRRVSGLKAVFNLGAGVDRLMKLPSLPRDLPVVRIEDGGMADQIAEYVAHALARVSRDFERYEAHQREGSWKAHAPITYAHWPVGVMGLGVIGRQVAQTLAMLGYPVAGWSRSARQVPNIETYNGPQGLHDFLARTRVLVNLLPLTPDTENLIDRDLLSRLLPEAYLINVARGAHLVDQDLLDLLDQGAMQGAFLDVFREEPLPKSHPYWTHPKVRITPHIAGITLASESLTQIIGKLDRLRQGLDITGIVSRTDGY
ncbi:MAG: glyoxylate/hydroxypyruvate reductase A [Candidimonas sp.]